MKRNFQSSILPHTDSHDDIANTLNVYYPPSILSAIISKVDALPCVLIALFKSHYDCTLGRHDFDRIKVNPIKTAHVGHDKCSVIELQFGFPCLTKGFIMETTVVKKQTNETAIFKGFETKFTVDPKSSITYELIVEFIIDAIRRAHISFDPYKQFILC